MQFRNKFCRHIVGGWEPYYIPYRHLKASLKAGERNGNEPFHNVYSRLATAIVASVAFAQQRLSVLEHDEEQLEKQWNDSALAKYRSDLAHLDFTSLQEALIELLWFYRINYEAMNRIYVRLVRSSHQNSPELETYRSVVWGHFEGYREAYNKCAGLLNRIQDRKAKSLGEQPASRIVAHQLDQDYGVVAAILHQSQLNMQGGYDRNLLDFGATHGMINLCTQVLSRVSPVKEYALIKNEAGLTPLHIAVARGNVEVAQLLLSVIDTPLTVQPDNLLHTALRREDDAMVKLLVSRSIGLRHMSSSAESCLYIAAQLGREDYLRLLLPVLGSDFIDAAESACHWTPLFVSCVEGHASAVRLLIDAGADTTRCDYLGWTAQENAVFRGHLALGELFLNIDTTPKLGISRKSNGRKRTHAPWLDVSSGLPHVIINLGSLQESGQSKSLTLNLPDMLGHGLMLTISTSESATSVERMMPLLDDSVDDTFVFAVKNLAETVVSFNIHECQVGRDKQDTLIGAGIAFLDSHTTCLGVQHGTLLREQSVPIMCKSTLRFLGTITFSYMIVGPYYQLQSPSSSIAFLEAAGSTQLVGHRGLGQNCREHFLQLGENTIESFLAAANQGADYVEVYVQVTRDLVPILFHDYSLSESGTDVPIHEVTLSQFMHASNAQSPANNSSPILGGLESYHARENAQLFRARSRSVAIAYEPETEQMNNRMKHTVDYLQKGFKPNTRGDFVHDTFATLEDSLCKLPEHIGVDMEIKYPRPHEAFQAGNALISLDINVFVDTTLDVIARFGRGRKIILSSFTPDICILLAIKQKSYPVVFITNAGQLPASDKESRAGSLQVAVRFAKQWGLAGIVVAADSLVMCPRLIKHIKSQGLVCGTYNALNNETANIELQVKAGIDLIVADRVKLVSHILKRLDSQQF